MKYLFLIFIFIYSLHASNNEEKILISKYISSDYKNYEKVNVNKLRKKVFTNVSIKLKINKEKLQNRVLYIKANSDIKSLVFTNIKYETFFDNIIFRIDKNTPSEILFNFKYEKEKKLDFRILYFNEFGYKYIIQNEAIIYGLSYGIVFCAFLYNFVLFLYTFQKSFIYYSLMQFFVLALLIDIPIIYDYSFIPTFDQMIIDMIETSCVLFTILFSKEILNSNKKMKKINRVFNFLIYLNIVDLIFIFLFKYSILYEFLPRTVIILFLVFSGILALFKGQKSAIFYILGWLVLLISLAIGEFKIIGIYEMYGIYILYLGVSFESLILSFALAYKLKQSIDEKKEKEEILIHQSKLALMGEMINNIAHQWRQPLTHLSYINMNLQLASEHKDLSEEYLLEKIYESNKQIDFMSETIDNFRDFYQPRKRKDMFFLSEAVKKSIDILKPSLDFSNIKLSLQIKKDRKIRAYENEYSQVILNLLTNAKDVLISRKINNPEIELIITVENNKSIVIVSDNANGIKEEYLNKIFEPYFTTKDKSSGIGLYMSKIIVESHLKGEIKVMNTLKGASFSIEV